MSLPKLATLILFFKNCGRINYVYRPRIKDIEAGVDLADIEVIPSSARAQDLYLDIVKSWWCVYIFHSL